MDYLLTIPDDLEAAEHAALLVAIDAHLAVVWPLRARVAVLATAAAKADEFAAEVDDALGRLDGRPWVQPVGAPFGYRFNALVTHGGRMWRSTRSGNVWGPGTSDSGWTDEGPAEGETPAPAAVEWVPDVKVWRADDPANPDPTRPVTLNTYAGTTYACIQSHTTRTGWEPPKVPALWAVV